MTMSWFLIRTLKLRRYAERRLWWTEGCDMADLFPLISAMMIHCLQCRLTLYQLQNWTMELTRVTPSVCDNFVTPLSNPFCQHTYWSNFLFSDIIGVVKEDEGIQEIISKASGKPVKCLLPCLIPYDALLTDINLYRSRKDSWQS